MDTREIISIGLADLFNTKIMIIAEVTILVVLFVRRISVTFRVLFFRFKIKFEDQAFSILTWDGLSEAISSALALSLSSKTRRHESILIT